MRSETRSLLGMIACLALFFTVTTAFVPISAQETASDDTSTAINNNLVNDDHDRGPRNGDLAVSAGTVVDGGYGTNQIATLPKDGGPYSFLTAVATVPNGGFDPDFTPDGRKILFCAFGDETHGDVIASVPTRGGPLKVIHTDCAANDPNCSDDNPAVSRDGQDLLTVRYVGPLDQNGCLVFAGIMRFRIDGSHAKRLSPVGPPCSGELQPRWSPNGEKIVFQHGDNAGLLSLWVMNRDGSHRHQITPAGLNYVGSPNWSPDGERIVFQSPAEAVDDQHPQQLYTIRSDGSHLRQITHYAIIPGVTTVTQAARWSPDGRKLVFSHRDPTTTLGPDGQPHGDLFEMNPDGSDVVQITFSPEKDNTSAWGVAR